MQQVCPIMSVSTVEAPKPGALLVGGKAPEPQFVQCVKQACAFFCPLQDEQGKVMGGGCAITLIPQALMALQQTVAEATLPGPEEDDSGNSGSH